MGFSHHWKLNSGIDFLNHGSFGATPGVVLDAQQKWIDALESDPIQFLAPERELIPRLDQVRQRVADLVRAPADSIAFVRNATDGVNAVLRSFPLRAGDEVLVTDHGYNACINAVRYATERAGATTRVAQIPFPLQDPEQVLEAIQAGLRERTRLLVVDHVTSPTGLVFPVREIVRLAQRRGTRVLVDGAHAPGMVPVDLSDLAADYYTANHHKWLCAPKASGFLYVDSRWQSEVRPTVISHGANRQPEGRSRFLTEFDWVGTYDPTPLLSVPAALDFLESLADGGLDGVMRMNHHAALRSQQILADALTIPLPAPGAMIGSLVSVPLPGRWVAAESAEKWQRRLFDEYAIEVPLFPGLQPGSAILRVSLQVYNSLSQIERLAEILRAF